MKYKLILLLLLLIPIVSSSGLSVTSDNSFTLNKTTLGDESIFLTLTNQENFPFYNITIDSPYVFISKIPILNPGESANITATITANEDIAQEIHITGSYFSELGTASETHYLTVNYYDGVNPCVKSVLEGDTVVWTNLAERDLKLINADTSTEISSLSINQSYNQTFLDPTVFNYYFTWMGWNIMDTIVCQLNVLSSSGLITNPEHDGIFNLVVNILYEPTLLETTFLDTSFTLDPFTTTEGIFSIKNTGDKIAKSINLEAKWFSFYDSQGNPLNEFDLSAGYSKTVSFIISPSIYQTNETNQTYNIPLTITGNFQTITRNFDVSINYADISGVSGGYTDFLDFFSDLYETYCKENPYEDICISSSGIILGNGSAQGNLSQRQMKEIMDAIFGYIQISQDNEKIRKSQSENQTSIMGFMNDNMTALREDMKRVADEKESDKTFLISVVVALLFVAILVIFFFVNKNLDFESSLKRITARFSGRRYIKK